MNKTLNQVRGDVFRLLKDSDLARSLSGSVYLGVPGSSNRPRGSSLEDAVVMGTTGESDEEDKGLITVNIFVPDIDPYGDGTRSGDYRRTDQIEAMAQQWVDGLNKRSEYIFHLRSSIHTTAEPTLGQHFVVIPLGYRRFAR